MARPRTYNEELHRKIANLYFDEDWSVIKISQYSDKIFGRFIDPGNISRSIRRYSDRFGYVHPKEGNHEK